MSNQYLKLRRSSVPGKIPDTGSLDFGELAINTYDGLVFMKKSGSLGEQVISIGGGGTTSGSFTGSFSGSFTGSLQGTASYAINALTASYLSGYVSPFPYTGNAVITGSLDIKSSGSASPLSIYNPSNAKTFEITSTGKFTVSRPSGDSGQTVNVYSNQDGSDGMYFQNDSSGGNAGIQLLMGNNRVSTGGSGYFQIYKGSSNNGIIADGTLIAEYGLGGIRMTSIGNGTPATAGPISFAIGGYDISNEIAWFNHPSYLSAFTAKNNINILSGSLRVFNGNVNVTGSIIATNGITGSLQGTASWAINSITSSYADNFTVAGTITAQKLIVQTITSSILYSSGSNIFGNNLTNTHQFTGSIYQTGSVAAFMGNVGIGTTTPSAKLEVNGNVTTGAVLNIGGSTGNVGELNFYNNVVKIARTGASGLDFYTTGGQPGLSLTSTSLFGIGTTTPNAKLDVSGSLNISGSGTQIPFQITSGPASLMYVSSSGNIGIRTNTPFSDIPTIGTGSIDLGNSNSSIYAGGYAILGKTNANGYGAVGSNYYLDNSNALRRRTGDHVSAITFNVGGFDFQSAGTGGVGSSVSFATLASLNNSGNFTIGNSSTSLGARVGIKGSGATSATTALLVQNSTTSASLSVLDNGNVGIGTSASAYPLEIRTSTVGLVVGNTGGNGSMYVGANTSAAVWSGWASTGPFINSGDGNRSIHLQSTGNANANINIGTTFESGYKLQVTGSAPSGSLNVNNTLYVSGSNVGIGTSSPTANLQIGNGSTGAINLYIGGGVGSDQTIGFNVNGNQVYHNIVSNGTTGEFRFNAGASGGGHFLTFRTGGNTERMRITSTGNVGIGTTSPLYNLDVSGSGRFTSDVNITGSGTATGAFNAGSFQIIGGGSYYINNSSKGGRIYSTDNSSRAGFLFTDPALTGAIFLQLGGSTSSFPAMKRNAAAIDFRLADDSGFANINVGSITANATSLISTIRTSYLNDFSNAVSAIQILTTSGNLNFFTPSLFAASGIINSSAQVQINSTTKGFLPPRTDLTSNITSPAQGLITYLTGSANEGLYLYNSGSVVGWQKVLTNTGSISITGDITGSNALFTGTITAQKLVVQQVTSSIIYSSGSNIFGSQLTDVQSFTGSLRVTGSGNHYVVGGNVGIGTITPTATLEVAGNTLLTGTDNNVLTISRGASPFMLFNYTGGSWRIGRNNTFDAFEFYNAASLFLIKPNGNLLINTTTDNGGKLQIKAGGTASTDIALRIRNSSDTADILKITGDNLVSILGRIEGRGSNTALSFGTQGSFGGVLGALGANLWSLGYSVSVDTVQFPTIVWNSSGSVGIGTTTPLYKLDVSGSGRFTSDVNITGSVIASNSITGGSTTISGNQINFGNSAGIIALSSTQLQIGTSAATTSILFMNNSTTSASLLLGGTSNLFPMIKRNAAAIDFRLADDSGYANINARSITASGSLTVTGSMVFTGDITGSNAIFTGTITAQKLVVQQVTSSVIYSSGSNQFGSQLTDIQSFTGSLRVTGSGNHWVMGGNVGIGIDNPTSPLHVRSTNAIVSVLNMETPTNAVAFSFNGSRSGFTYAGGGGAFFNPIFGFTGNNIQIGLGNLDASARLHVRGAGATSSTTGLLVQNSNASASLEVRDDGKVTIGRTNGAYIEVGTLSNFYNTSAGYDHVFRVAGGEVARITSTGNVGIGETSPLTALDIRTSLNTTITPLSSVPNASTTVLIGNTGTNGVLAIGHNNTAQPWLQGRSRLAGQAAEDILINPLGGNVGIGTTTPNA
jgi:hypothetical protein